jgi:hypothetical protein
VHPQLSQTMPERHEIQQIQDCTVMGFWKETIENRNGALSGRISMKVYIKPDKDPTCNRSSKSLAANPFNSEQLLENRCMVFLPNTGICRYLSHQNDNWLLHTPRHKRHLTVDLIHPNDWMGGCPTFSTGGSTTIANPLTQTHASGLQRIANRDWSFGQSAADQKMHSMMKVSYTQV